MKYCMNGSVLYQESLKNPYEGPQVLQRSQHDAHSRTKQEYSDSQATEPPSSPLVSEQVPDRNAPVRDFNSLIAEARREYHKSTPPFVFGGKNKPYRPRFVRLVNPTFNSLEYYRTSTHEWSHIYKYLTLDVGNCRYIIKSFPGGNHRASYKRWLGVVKGMETNVFAVPAPDIIGAACSTDTSQAERGSREVSVDRVYDTRSRTRSQAQHSTEASKLVDNDKSSTAKANVLNSRSQQRVSTGRVTKSRSKQFNSKATRRSRRSESRSSVIELPDTQASDSSRSSSDTSWANPSSPTGPTQLHSPNRTDSPVETVMKRDQRTGRFKRSQHRPRQRPRVVLDAFQSSHEDMPKARNIMGENVREKNQRGIGAKQGKESKKRVESTSNVTGREKASLMVSWYSYPLFED